MFQKSILNNSKKNKRPKKKKVNPNLNLSLVMMDKKESSKETENLERPLFSSPNLDQYVEESFENSFQKNKVE